MNLLFLAHRIPYPPNKGDKIRSYHELKYLCARHRVHLGCLADQPEDRQHIPKLMEMAASVAVSTLDPRQAQLRSARALVSGEPLSVRYFHTRPLQRWVEGLVAREKLDAAFLFSSPMAAYVWDVGLPRVMDFCDVDSDKWRQYARRARWPRRAVYALEARRLRAYEEAILRRFDAATLVTARERDLWKDLPEELLAKVHVIPNGVDLEYFTPQWGQVVPEYGAIVFTGAMDYRANVDAVTWFTEEVLPRVREEIPQATFYIVGSRPTPRVRALADRPGVVVTGTVDDVRPYYARAALCVVPLRIARGIQNKVLEAMAMGRPVLASPSAAAGLEARLDDEICVADDSDAMVCEVVRLLHDTYTAESIGRAARRFVEREYVWENAMRGVEALLEASVEKRQGAPVTV